MRIEIHLPDDKKFVEKLQALADADKRSRKNWLETQIISIVEKSTLPKKNTGRHDG
jgi:predicted transcriptional regulator